VFDRFLNVFKGVLVDLGVPDGKIGELMEVFEGARGRVRNTHVLQQAGVRIDFLAIRRSKVNQSGQTPVIVI
jgi:hypothetical protein